MSENRVLFSCVAENRRDFFDKAEGLVLSLRRFGGALSEEPFVVHFIDGVRPEYRTRLLALGADVRVVPRRDVRNPWANKLRMLELHELPRFEHLVALDCDVVVVGDLSQGIVWSEQVMMKPADYDRLKDRDWARLFSALGIPLPQARVVATSTGRQMIPYFNTGVLVVPRSRCEELRIAWAKSLDDIYVLFDRQPHVVPRPWQWHADQMALACALAESRLKCGVLPVSVNFPTHAHVKRSSLAGIQSLYALHYHQQHDGDGFLHRAKCSVADPYIDRYNRVRAEALGITYNGLTTAEPGRRMRRNRRRLRRRLDARLWSLLGTRDYLRRGPR